MSETSFARDAAPAPTVPRFAMPAAPIRVELADACALAQLVPAWTDLAKRGAEPNPFLHPALIAAAGARSGRPVAALLAWAGPRLVGIWAFERRGRLRAPLHPMAMLGGPLVVRDRADGVIDALVEALATHPALPALIAIDHLDADGPTTAALRRALAARGRPFAVVGMVARPVLDLRDPPAGGGGATRKKLRQRRRRLAEAGALTTTRHGPDAAAAFEEFLALEAAGWKGGRGTALAAAPREAAFARRALAGMAATGHAFVMALRQEGRLLAIQVLMRCGDAAFTWKTAYDEEAAAASPGMLLLEDCVAALTADPSLATADSCCDDDTTSMAAAWPGRRRLVSAMFDVRSRGNARLAVAAAAARGRRRLRETARSLYRRLCR